MSSSNEETTFLDELKKFIGFLQNLWAILAGVSILFPLSNVLAQIIPLAQWGEGGLTYLSPQLVTVISTVACLFVILWTFGQRDQFARQRKRRSTQKQAGLSFAFGVMALIIYLVVHYAVMNDFYFIVLEWESGDLRRVLGDIVLLLAYSAFFVLITRAFMLLGMMEYFGQKGHAA
jgi:hypothetical protein